MCKNHDELATLPLRYVNCLIFLATELQKTPEITKNFKNLNQMVDCDYERTYFQKLKNKFTPITNNATDVQPKFAP